MKNELIPEFIQRYNVFKQSEEYQRRSEQLEIVPIFRDIIRSTLNSGNLSDSKLTGFIQMFKPDVTESTFDKYLQICVSDKNEYTLLLERWNSTSEKGLTGAGLNSIADLSRAQLNHVKAFLLEAFEINSTQKSIEHCQTYESLNIPFIKSGVYSPWLYYINPTVFPILNNSHINFRKWIDIPSDYSSCLEHFTHLKNQVNEADFGLFDRFTHNFNENGPLEPMRVLKLYDRNIYKISHGDFAKKSNYRNTGILEIIKENNWICMHINTGKGQGAAFKNKVEIGDFVYVVNGQELGTVGRIISEAKPLPVEIDELVDGDQMWYYREIEPICHPINFSIKDLTDDKRFFMPSGYSTFYRLPVEDEEEFQYLNNVLFKAKYNLKILTSETMGKNQKLESTQELSSLNTILYGPPGTGKTFELLRLIDNYSISAEESNKDLKLYDFVKNYTWWEIIAMALFDSNKSLVPDLLKHPLIKSKQAENSIKNLSNRLWYTLQTHTVDDCPNVKYERRTGDKIFFKEIDSVWRLNSLEDINAQYDYLINDWEAIQNADSKSNAPSISFFTCHQSLSYEDFIEGIKPVFDEETKQGERNNLTYSVRKGLFYNACEKASIQAGYASLEESIKDTKENRKRKFGLALQENKVHYILLDEINRCNISAVFGELITLIEEDKRLGADNEVSNIQLPYSQSYFGVPLNLKIIGTMNTADRSVEALDTALRRRFEFIPKMPKEHELKANIEGISLSVMLTTLNERLRILKDNDHTIGHAWLWDVKTLEQLKKVFASKILPLLQEYFYNDYEKLGLVLGDAFFELPHQKVKGNELASFKSSSGLASQYKNKYLYKLKDPNILTIEDFLTLTKETNTTAENEDE